MAQLELFELVLQFGFLLVGKVKLLWKLRLLLQQLLEVPLLASAGLNQLVIIVAMNLVLLYRIRIQLSLMILYPSALDIFQLLCKSKSWLEAVWDRLAIDLRIIQKRIYYRLLLLGRSHLVVLLSVWVLL